jgi:parallel beta-helix repeat protein
MRYYFVAFLLMINLQILYSNEIREFYIKCDTADFNYMYENYEEDHYIPIELETEGEKWTNVEMRIRGDDSREYPKKSLKIKFNDEPFLNGRDKINLNAEYTDPTFTRQFLASHLFQQAGHPCFKSEQVRLYLNGEYFGLYLMVENMDSDFLAENDLDPIGNLYKATHDAACLSIFDDVYKSWEKKTNEHHNWDDLQELIDSLENIPEREYYDFCKRTFDYDKMLNIIALNMLLANGSTYYHNYYMYHDIHGSGKWMMLPWDMDKTFIAYSKYFPYHSTGQIWIHDNPFVERAIASKKIMEDLKVKLLNLHETYFNNDYLDPIIDSLSITLYESVANDNTIDIDSMDVYYNHIDKIKDFIKDRYYILISQINSLPMNFKIHRLTGMQSGDVAISWERSFSPLGNDISYTIYLSPSSRYPKNATIKITDIKDTTYTCSELDYEGRWYYRVEATDGKHIMPGWDDFNYFDYKIGYELPCDIYDEHIITKENSPAYVNCQVTVHKGASLIVEPGAEVWFADSTMILILGNIQLLGSVDDKILILPDKGVQRGMKIEILSSEKECNLHNFVSKELTIYSEHSQIDLMNADFSCSDSISQGGTQCFVYVSSGIVSANSCYFYGNQLFGGIIVKFAEAEVKNSIFYYVPDAIEYDPCDNGIINNNHIFFSNDDAIDLNGCTNVSIIGNELYDSYDKAISIGKRLERYSDSILIKNNIISGNTIGIALKTTKNIDIINNTFYGNDHAVISSVDDGEDQMPEARFINTIITNSKFHDILLTDGSNITFSYCLSKDSLLEGLNNIKADPLFIDPENGDFSLQPDSPCINAGDPKSPRDPDGSRADIGAIPYIQQQGIVINEICYNPPDDRDCGDWVELYNPTEFPIDMSNWYFNDENYDNIYYFPDKFRLLPASYIVLSNDLINFEYYFPEVTNVIGEFDFGFSGSGELLRLYNSEDELVDHVLYDDKKPWPTEPDGDGPTLELISPDLDNALPESWQSSDGFGTPGRKNSEPGTVVDEIVLSDGISMSVYPNPVDNILHLSVNSNQSRHYNLFLVNQLGQKIEIETKNIFQQGRCEHHIDLSKFSAGVYYLIAETLSESSAIMIIKR